MVTQQTPNIQAMTQGANFITVVRTPAHAGQPGVPGSASSGSNDVREVFVWYEREDSKLGDAVLGGRGQSDQGRRSEPAAAPHQRRAPGEAVP